MTHANLTPERGPSVWDRQARSAHARDTVERALVGGTGLALLLFGLRGRSRGRRTTAAVGASLLALAGTPRALDRVRAWGDLQRRRLARRDLVTDQSDQSFPASDAPAWTATTAGAVARGDRE